MPELLVVLEVLRALNLAMEIAVSLMEIWRKKNAKELTFQCVCCNSKKTSNQLND